MIKNRHSSADNKFFRQMWEEKDHVCEECYKPLFNYSATFISHYLSKGSYPALRYEKKNISVLCAQCHFKWDFGDKKTMRIYSVKKTEGLRRLSYGIKEEITTAF